MARYIANPDYFDTIDTGHAALRSTGIFGGVIGFFKNIVQGMCAGGMTFVGVLNTIGADLSVLPHLPLENLINKALNNMQIGEFAASPYAGPVEIAVGAALFLTAGRGIARTIGLLGVIFYITAVATGTDISQYTGFLSDIFKGAQAGWEHFQTLQDSTGPQATLR